MKKLLFLNLYFWCFLTGIFAQQLSPEQMKEDLSIFREGLEKFHPEMYRFTDQQTFETQFKSIESQLDSPLSQRDFYNLLNPVLVSLRDGHIKWIVQGKDQHYAFFEEDLFPVRLYFEEEKVYALSHFGNETIPELAEVEAINGIPIQTIKAKLIKELSFGDGMSLAGKYHQLNRYFSAYFSTTYGVSNTYSIDWKVEGESQKWSAEGVSKSEIENQFLDPQSPFSFQIKDKSIGILKIGRFFSTKEEHDLSKFLKSAFQILAEKNISKLIIDLRGNEGGIEKMGIELYKYIARSDFRYYDHLSTKPNQKVDFEQYTSKIFRLANSFSRKKDGVYKFTIAPGLNKIKPNRQAFKGDVILLLDGQSFSVTTEFASRAQSDGRVFIIGEETAGGAAGNTSGFFTIIPLPHSKIDLGIPRLGFHMADIAGSVDINRGVIPDQVIIPSASDILSGNDPVMERALQKFSKQKIN